MNIASLEDDAAQGQLINKILTEGGHKCTTFSEGKQIIAALTKDNEFDLILLDWEVPDISGLDVLRWIRANKGYSLPVIIVTNRTTEPDLVTGLQAGADDYINKPISSGALLARINALQRRTSVAIHTESDTFTCGVYTINPSTRSLFIHDKEIDLAPKEYDLAELFFRNPGRLFSRDVLSFSVWNRDIPATSRTLDTHLSNVRRKLHLHPENGVRLHSSYALGYRLELISE